MAPLVSRWVERLLAGHDPPLTPAQYLVLQAIADADVVGADLARRAAVSPAAVSQLLGALEAAGLLERNRSADDRRRQALALSQQGSGVLASASSLLRQRMAELLAPLPPHEAAALAHALGGAGSLLADTAPPPRPPKPPRPSGHGPGRGLRGR